MIPGGYMKKRLTANPGENSMNVLTITLKFKFLTCFLLLGALITLAVPQTWADALVGTTYESSAIPWSGYWWPHSECGLATGEGYHGAPSPLERYELYTTADYPGNLTQWYTKTYCEGEILAWYGHCGHWALAASAEDIDFLPSVVNNIVFRVGDKKGLLTLCHNDDVAVSGDGTQPDEFHYWLLKYIQGEKTSIVADLSADEEVWQYPIYGFEILKKEISDDRESITVKVYYASDKVHPDYIGTKEQFTFYYYDLLLNDSGDIIGGEWTGNSVDDHPQKMYSYISQSTSAPDIDYDLVKQIAQSQDDELEIGSSKVVLPPGNYNLILLDEDNYILDSHAGDTISANIEILDGGGSQLIYEITDNDDQVIAEGELSAYDTSIQINIESENPPYTLAISKSDYATPGIYSIEFDLDKTISHIIPYIPKSGMYSGFAITNTGDEIRKKINIVAYSQDGAPLQTLLGPMEIGSGAKKTFLFRNLPFRDYEYASIDSLRIISDEALGVINVTRNLGGNSAGMDSGQYTGANLVIPDTAANLSFVKTVFWRVTNEADSQGNFTLNLYSSDGSLVKTSNVISLAPKASYHLSSGQSPFTSMPESGWIELKGENGDENFSVFEQITYAEGELETIFAQPIETSRKIIPHIPDSKDWNATAVLINPGNATVEVRFHPVMAGDDASNDHLVSIPAKAKVTVDLHEFYDRDATDPLYSSITALTCDSAFTGYYRNESDDFSDTSIFPLLSDSDFSSRINLSHTTGKGGYWTGLCFLNPDANQSVSVLLRPYGGDGNAMTALEKEFKLQPGEYRASTVFALYPDDYGDISFLKFETTDSEKKLGGFFIYGCETFGLWGGNLSAAD